MNRDLLESAINKLDIHDISLSTCNITMKDGFVPTLNKKPLTIQFINMLKSSSMADIHDTDKYSTLLIYYYVAGFRGLPQDLPDEIMSNEELLKEHVLVEVTATFNAIYFSKEELSEEEIKEFGLSNVGFNVWPYWREYASSIAERLRLPHFIVPLKRVKDIQNQQKSVAKNNNNNLD